jgi:peptidoglycan/xylan/chitin deacetylase (PgdA/CDA1 family)
LLHRVTDAIAPDGLTISCARFRDLCRMLAERFHVVPLAEIFRLARSGAVLPRRTVAITFDDCYYDNLAAARVLAEFGLPATFFLPTAYVGTDHVFAWDRGLNPMANLSWDDVDEMRRLGFTFGSHTVTHPDLGTTSQEQTHRELVESKAVLEDRLGSVVRWFAYPFGGPNNFRLEWLPLLTQIGYEGCVSGYGGLVPRGMQSAILPRVPVPAFDDLVEMEVYLSGGLNWYYKLRRCLKMPFRRVGTNEIPDWCATRKDEDVISSFKMEPVCSEPSKSPR